MFILHFYIFKKNEFLLYYVQFFYLLMAKQLTQGIVNKLTTRNDYENLKDVLDKNPDFDINLNIVKLLKTAITKRLKKSFDIIINHPKFDNNKERLSFVFHIAYKLYNIAKNESNRYYILQLLEKNIYVDAPELPLLINYDIDIYNRYIEQNINNSDYILKLLEYLVVDKYFNHYLDLINKIPNIVTPEFLNQFIKTNVYVIHISNKIAFNHYMNLGYDLNKIVDDPVKVLKMLINFKHEPMINMMINYLTINPINLENIQLNIQNYIFADCFDKKWGNKINKPLIINSPKIDIFKTYLNKINYIKPLTIYIYYKMGLNINIYDNLDKSKLLPEYVYTMYIENNEHKKHNIIETIKIGRYINQNIPDDLIEPFYKLCNNSPELDHIITDKEMKQLLNK